MDNMIRHILEIIPDSYAEEFPMFSVFEAYSPCGAEVQEENNLFCDPSLLQLPRDVAIGTLAHEFAHLFLQHADMKSGLQQEYEADALACQWGFSAEVKAMRQYLGPPTEQQGG